MQAVNGMAASTWCFIRCLIELEGTDYRPNSEVIQQGMIISGIAMSFKRLGMPEKQGELSNDY